MKLSDMQVIPSDSSTLPNEKEPRNESIKFRYHQMDMDGELIKTWEFLTDVHGTPMHDGIRKLNRSSIESCCTGKRASHGGYTWWKEQLTEAEQQARTDAMPRPYFYRQTNMKGELIKIWGDLDSIGDVPTACGSRYLVRRNVMACCNGFRKSHGGFRWEKIKVHRYIKMSGWFSNNHFES